MPPGRGGAEPLPGVGGGRRHHGLHRTAGGENRKESGFQNAIWTSHCFLLGPDDLAPHPGGPTVGGEEEEGGGGGCQEGRQGQGQDQEVQAGQAVHQVSVVRIKGRGEIGD